MAEIAIPSVGIAMEEALVVRWLKEPGEEVSVDEAVVEIETDKATMDVVSPVAGTLGPHLVAAGAIVAVGTTIVHVLSEGDAAPAPAGAASEAPQAAGAEPEDAAHDPEGAAHEPEGTGASGGGRAPHALSPRARRLNREREQAPAASGAPAEGRFRELIAAKVAESWREIPHFTVSREVDAGPMQALLEQLRGEGVDPRPTFTDLLLRAHALALAEPAAAAAVDVGLAVATESGVVIAVVRDVLALGAPELARARSDAVERARAGKLSQDDLGAAPSSTLSNLGAFGVDRFTGIIALGQRSLLTVGRALPRVVADQSHAIRVQTTFDATLNVDHRSVDGAEAARLLVAFANAAEGMSSDGWGRRS